MASVLLHRILPCLLLFLSASLTQSHALRRPVGDIDACDISVGSWVWDETYPLYQRSECPLIDVQFDCQLFGRPDAAYLKYRWQPTFCTFPRFDGVEFLERSRDMTVTFVGDSLGKNQWESLVCLLSSTAPWSPPVQRKAGNLSSFVFLDYNLSVSFYWAPYLVDMDDEGGKRALKLDNITRNAMGWGGADADVLIFNSGHWWTHKGNSNQTLWNCMEDGGVYYQDMDHLVAFQKGLSTWANWVDANVNASRTSLFFQSISPIHNNANWPFPASTNCYLETQPIRAWNYTGNDYAAQMGVVTQVLNTMNNTPYLLDITALSALRKDAHPSIYNGALTPSQRADPADKADCSHWCLPGLPDTWNELLYNALYV